MTNASCVVGQKPVVDKFRQKNIQSGVLVRVVVLPFAFTFKWTILEHNSYIVHSTPIAGIISLILLFLSLVEFVRFFDKVLQLFNATLFPFLFSLNVCVADKSESVFHTSHAIRFVKCDVISFKYSTAATCTDRYILYKVEILSTARKDDETQ